MATETWTGSNGNPWPSSPNTWVAKNSGVAVLNAGRGALTAPSGPYASAAMTMTSFSAADVDLTVDVTIGPTLVEQYAAVGVRHDGTFGGGNFNPNIGYAVNLELGASTAVWYLSRGNNDGGGMTVLSTTQNQASAAGATLRIRLQATGSTIQAKVWRVSGTPETEPASWEVSVTGETTWSAAGSVWVETGNGNTTNPTMYWDNLTVTGGATGATAMGVVATGTGVGRVPTVTGFSSAAVTGVRAVGFGVALVPTVSGAVAVSPSGPVPSHSYVTIAASYSGTSTAVAFEWVQVSGPMVTLIPNDPLGACIVKIPALWVEDDVVIQVRALETGGSTGWVTCTLTAARHRIWQVGFNAFEDHPLGEWAILDMPGLPVVPLNPDPPYPILVPEGDPTNGAWFTALPPGYGLFKSLAVFWPPFPVSVNNEPEPAYWVRNWLTPVVEGTTDHRVYGGLVRDRPLDDYAGDRPLPTGWQQLDAEQNVTQAAGYGLDGFLLNLLGDLTSGNNVRNLAIRDAAGALYPGGEFKTVPMPDLTSTVINALTADGLADLLAPFAVVDPTPGLTTYARVPSAWYLPDGRFVWACTNGDVATGGGLTAWPKSRFDAVFASLSSRYKINTALILGVTDYTTAASYTGTGYYGFNQWDTGADPNVARAMVNMTTVARSRSQVYAMSIWAGDVRPNQALYDDSYNTEALRAYGDRLISDAPDYAQLATWSDFSSGSAFQRSAGKGRVLQKLFAWYAYKRKTGVFPTILRDTVILSHRDQLFPSGSTYRYDPSGLYSSKMAHWNRGANTSTPRNNVEVLTFLIAPAAVTLKVGTTTVAYTAPGGMYAHALTPAQVGAVTVDVKRNGVSIAAVTSPFTITATPFNQNPLYYMMDSLDGTDLQYDPVETNNP